jgi:translation initiation factor IF-3
MSQDFRRHRVPEPRVNQRIRSPQVKLIDKNGTVVGVVPLSRALVMAREDGLDVVEVQPNVSPPVCKIIDYGKYKYELKKKSKESKKKQHVMEEKQVRFRVNTSSHDVETKIRHARKFLEEGDKVIFTIRLRGREHEHKEEARLHFTRCKKELGDVAKIEMDVRQDGNTMMMSLVPLPRKGGGGAPKAAVPAPPAAPVPPPATAPSKPEPAKGE